MRSRILLFSFSILFLLATLYASHEENLSFHVTRDGAVGYGSRTEKFDNKVSGISISESQEYFVTCSGSNVVQVYRVLMYPNNYPDWPYLLYGRFATPSSNVNRKTVELINCKMTPDENYIFTLHKEITEQHEVAFKVNTFKKVTFKPQFYRTNTSYVVDNSILQYQALSNYGFEIIHPRDEYSTVFTPIDNHLVSASSAASSLEYCTSLIHFDNLKMDDLQSPTGSIAKASLRVSPDSQWILVWMDKRVIIHDRNCTSRSSWDFTSSAVDITFSYDSNTVFIALADGRMKALVLASSESEWVEVDVALTTPWKATLSVSKILHYHAIFCRNNSMNLRTYKHYSVAVCPCQREFTTSIAFLTYDEIQGSIEYKIFVAGYSKISSGNTTTIKMVVHSEASAQPDEASASNRLKPIIRSYVKRVINKHVDPILALSSDDRVLATIYHQPNEQFVDIYVRDEHTNQFRRAKHLIVSKQIGYTVTSVSIIVLEHYYLNLGLMNGEWIQLKLLDPVMPPKCDPRTRITSFYLPPAPHYQKTMDEELDMLDMGVLRIYDMPMYMLERSGIFSVFPKESIALAVIALVVFATIPLFNKIEKAIYQKVSFLHAIRSFLGSAQLFNLACFGMFALSVFEILFQPNFVNDWPAHLHHVEQFFLESTLDYSHYMHYHGPNTYGAGFLWVYTFLYNLTGQYVQLFQLIWAILELLHYKFMRHFMVHTLHLNPIYTLLLFSNRLHLYNVRVVVNDFPSVVFMHVAIYFLLKRNLLLGSILYSFVVSTKLNFVFYAPAILVLLIYMTKSNWKQVIYYLFVMAFVQVMTALPFLLTNYKSYIALAFDLKRTLLWEKTRHFKFVGRLYYGGFLNHALLGITALILLFFLKNCYTRLQNLLNYKQQQPTQQKKRLSQENASNQLATFATRILQTRILSWALFGSNFLFVALSRGLYTPFMCWYFYSYPIVLALAGFPLIHSILFFVGHEMLFRFFNDLRMEMFSSYVLLLLNAVVVLKMLYASFPSPNAADETKAQLEAVQQEIGHRAKVE